MTEGCFGSHLKNTIQQPLKIVEVVKMDVSGISSTGSALTQGGLNEAVQIAVLKKAIDIEAQGALQLIQGAAQVAANTPPNLGNGVDTFA